MRNHKGVSMIELVIVIVILLIITTFSIFSGREAIEQAEVTELYVEMNSVREAVNSINVKKELNENFELTKGEHYDKKASELNAVEADFEDEYGIEIESGDFDDLYIIYGMDELGEYNKSSVKQSYGFDSIKHTYLINFAKVKVDLLNVITVANRNVRTYEQVRSLVDDGEI